MSLRQSHPHHIARPLKNRFMRKRSRFVSCSTKQAEQRQLGFHQAGVSDTNSIPVQTKGRFLAFP
jgi:hypothetical protein